MSVLTEEQQNCEHEDFEDVTEERRAYLETTEIPSYAKALIEKGNRNWLDKAEERKTKSERWRTLKYMKCKNCGLLRITDQLKEAKE